MGISLVRALEEARECTIAVNGDVFMLNVEPTNDSFVWPIRELHYRHGVARVMKLSAWDREDGRDLIGYRR